MRRAGKIGSVATRSARRRRAITADLGCTERQQLERVLASVTFRQVDRLKRFLSFIVSEALDGPRRSAQGIRHRRPGLRQGLLLRSARRPDRPRAGAAPARAAGALLPRRRRQPTPSSSSCRKAATRRCSRRARRRRRDARLDRRRRSPARTRSRSMPFADHSPAQDLAYFCEGLRQEIIHRLAKLEGAARAGRCRPGHTVGQRARPTTAARPPCC